MSDSISANTGGNETRRTVPMECKVSGCRWTWRQPEGQEPECPRCKRLKDKAPSQDKGPTPKSPTP